MRPIRVLLVDDQVLLRQGLRKLLEVEDGIEVAGEAADGIAALESVRHDPPDVALVDARMPRMDGVKLIQQLTADHPQVACLVLSTFDEDDYILGALRAGASGYLLKDCSPEELVAGIRKAHAGETVLDGPAAARVVASLRTPPPQASGQHQPAQRPAGPAPAGFPGAELLSPRELDVVGMVVNGASNREIATRLFITEGTVKNHVSSVLRKLGLRDRTQLALHATGPGSRPRP